LEQNRIQPTAEHNALDDRFIETSFAP